METSKIIKYGNKEFLIITNTKVTKSKKTKRPKYQKCLICPETRYIERHHIHPGLTVPICPIHHKATLMGDLIIIKHGK